MLVSRAEIMKNIYHRFSDFSCVIFLDFDCQGVYLAEQMSFVVDVPTQQFLKKMVISCEKLYCSYRANENWGSRGSWLAVTILFNLARSPNKPPFLSD